MDGKWLRNNILLASSSLKLTMVVNLVVFSLLPIY